MNLRISICNECKAAVYPPRNTCPYCRSSRVAYIDSESSQGQILSFTSLEMPPAGFTPPVVLALIKLSEGATVLALASDAVASSLSIGQDVLVTQNQEGLLVFTPR